MYIEYFGVVKAMEMVKNEPGSAQKSIEEIRRDLNTKFDTQYVDDASVPPQAISVRREAGGATCASPMRSASISCTTSTSSAWFDKSVILRNASGGLTRPAHWDTTSRTPRCSRRR